MKKGFGNRFSCSRRGHARLSTTAQGTYPHLCCQHSTMACLPRPTLRGCRQAEPPAKHVPTIARSTRGRSKSRWERRLPAGSWALAHAWTLGGSRGTSSPRPLPAGSRRSQRIVPSPPAGWKPALPAHCPLAPCRLEAGAPSALSPRPLPASSRPGGQGGTKSPLRKTRSDARNDAGSGKLAASRGRRQAGDGLLNFLTTGVDNQVGLRR